jgi:ribosomal protein L11 methyltransferase
VKRYRVRVPAAEAEPALARMLDLFPGGLEEEHDGDDVILAGYAERAPAAGLECDDVEPGWEDRWREYHRPVTVGRIWVGAPWHTGDSPQPVSIVIDPGRAFGTGGHGSTRAALALLQRLDPQPVLDLGCGSGVLAIAAARLGWDPVSACDYDPVAVEATRANAVANGVRMDTARLDLRVDALPVADTVAANLLHPLLIDLAARLCEDRPACLIASGLLVHEADDVAGAFRPAGLVESARRSDAGWTALLLTRQ